MLYTLILCVYSTFMGNVATALTTAEFTTIESCTQAGESALKGLSRGDSGRISYVCVKKVK